MTLLCKCRPAAAFEDSRLFAHISAAMKSRPSSASLVRFSGTAIHALPLRTHRLRGNGSRRPGGEHSLLAPLLHTLLALAFPRDRLLLRRKQLVKIAAQ